MSGSILPAVNAVLNAVATLLLAAGFVLIRLKHAHLHMRCMMSAFGVSCLFLVLYVTDKLLKGGVHTPYHGEGWLRIGYYVMLASHVLLAMTVPIFAVLLIRLALTRRFDRHRRLARIAWPIWMYVSLTGIAVYLMLYHFNPPGGSATVAGP